MSVKQDIFDRVARHLLTQKVKCVETNADGDWICLYRGRGETEGLSCAVGCLINDEYYDPKLEYSPASNVDVGVAIAESLGIAFRDLPMLLLLGLQEVHDQHAPGIWRRSLGDVAERFNLSPAVLEEFSDQ